MLFSQNLNKKEIFHSEYLDEDIVDLLSGTFRIDSKYQSRTVHIDPGYESRWDLIAEKALGDDIYHDVLLKLNGHSNPFEVFEGQIILLPTEDEVNNFFQNPSKEWSEAGLGNIFRPKPKAKNEKRKPNEAVVGDKRFNIDQLSKIVIY